MRIRIIREPNGILNGSELSRYRTGEVYDLPVIVAEYLVVEGFAIIEMRNHESPGTPVAVERRQSGRRA